MTRSVTCSLSSMTFMASFHCCSAPAKLDSAPAADVQFKFWHKLYDLKYAVKKLSKSLPAQQ